MSSDKKLPPIDFTEDIEKYKAKHWKKEVSFDCPHKDVKIQGRELRCRCGASWSGPRLNELYRVLTRK